MPKGTLTVVISAGQSRNPEKRGLEQAVATAASQLNGVQVLRIPHLYDLAKNGETYQHLQRLPGDLVLISWLFTRAAHWILDRNGVRGQVGEVELQQDFDEDTEPSAPELEGEQRVADVQPRPARQIYTLDFRASENPQDFVAEIERIAQLPAAASTPLTLEMLGRLEQPTNDTYVGSAADSSAVGPAANSLPATLFGTSSLVSVDEQPARRWYPVIDFSRCTNCMECIDFCLFGVYGVDALETIVVEQADNCRKGCPACSRVCPQNAIIFPQHKSPAIAGAPVDAGGLKIDLSKLFGAPDAGEDAAAVAIRERDEQLLLAGRQAVGVTAGISERLAEKATGNQDADAFDDLLDQLDSLDL
ncbi:MAG: ferredoxin family protein [Planctomycetales bacterium]|nr:ferredoxin family protein [Planctomycetales bacterium]